MRKLLTREAMPLLVTYVLLAAISVAMFFLARSFPSSSMGAAAPGFFPQVISALLLVLSLAGILELARVNPEPVVFPPRVMAAMGLALGYIAAMHLFGYYPSTMVFSFLIMKLVRDGTKSTRVALDAAIITLFSYLFFEVMIDTYLPTGTVFR